MNPLRILLLPFSCLYGLGIALWKGLYRSGVYRTGKVPVPVLSVGNVTVGGNGKTPMVIALAKWLEERGHHVGILSRGYGREKSPGREVVVFSGRGIGKKLVGDPPDPRVTGDEPALISSRVPSATIALSSDRLEGARALLPFSPSVIVMDDGFQSLELFQDLSFVLVSESDFLKILDRSGWGCRDLLPSGRFREGEEALFRASAVVVTLEEDRSPLEMERLRSRFDLYFQKRFPARGVLPVLFQKMVVSGIFCQNEMGSGETGKGQGPEAIKGKRVVLVSGIAAPGRFFRMVSGFGAEVLGHLSWSDHASWNEGRQKEILSFLESVSGNATPEMILTTEKDLVKWPKPIHLPYTVYSVQIESCLLEPAHWESILLSVVRKSSVAPEGETPDGD